MEEVHRKLRDVLLISYEVHNNEKLVLDSEKYTTFRQQVLVAERLVLQTIAFDLTVEHPYRFLQEHGALVTCKEDERKSFMQTAWNYVNDSFASAVCLQYRPQLVAAAAIYLAAKNHRIEIKWWQATNVNMDDLKGAVDQILESFPSNNNNTSSTSGPSNNSDANSAGSGNQSPAPVVSGVGSNSSPSTASPSGASSVPPGQRLKRKEPDIPTPAQ